MSLQRRAPAVPGGGGAPTSAQQANRKRLEELLKLPDNAVCADCPERGPRWASATLGTFVCIKCSGIHRNLGVHISFVRSVNLDEWKQEHVEQMERWGNARARAYFEAEVPPGYARPSDWSNVHQMTRWIKDKYEYKRFIPRDGALPPEKQRAAAASPSPSTNNEPPSSSSSTRERKPRDRPAGGATQPTAQSSSKPVMAAAAPAAKPKVVDLLDFSEPDPPAPQQQPQQQPPQQAAAGAAFGAGGFDAFGAPAPPPQQPQQPAALQKQPLAQLTSAGKPKLTPDQLISMFMQQQPQQPSSSAPPAPMAPTATPWGAPPPFQQPQQAQQQQAAFGFPPSFQQQLGMVPPQQVMMGGAAYGGSGFAQQHSNPYAPPQSPYGQQPPFQAQPAQQGFGAFPGAMPQQQQQQHASPFGPSSSSTFPPHQPSGGNGGFPSPFGHPSNPFG